MYRFKVSKYKNAAPKIPKKEMWITEVPVNHVMQSCGDFLKASGKHIAFNVESGVGGCAGILSLDAIGRKNKRVPTIYAHSEFLGDMDFSPFDDDLLATCAQDGFVKLWRIPPNFGEKLDNAELSITPNHSSKRVESVSFHPSADRVLACTVHETVQVIDIENGAVKYVCSTGADESFQSLTWKLDGSVLVTSNKDVKNRVIDPRAEKVAHEFEGFGGSKDSRVTWLGNYDYIFGTGFSKQRKRQYALWDVRNLKSKVQEEDVDSGGGVLMTLYDADTNLIFLAGKGDTSVSLLEFSDESKTVTFSSSQPLESQTYGIGMAPKRVMNVMEGEVARLFQLAKNTIVPLPYIVPRKSYREFHADLFPDTVYAGCPAMTSEEWFGGSNKPITRISLDPSKRKADVVPIKQVESKKVPLPVDSKKDPQQVESKKTAPAEAAPSLQGSSATSSEETVASAPLEVKEKEKPARKGLKHKGETAPDPGSRSVAKPAGDIFQGVHQPKFKHLFGEFLHKSKNIDNVKNLSESLPSESDGFVGGHDLVALPLSGAGGQVAVLQLSKPGRLPDSNLPVLQNGCAVLDVAMDPFDSRNIAVACEDWHIRIWRVPEEGLTETCVEPVAVLKGHAQRVTIVKYHPTASNILVSASLDLTVRVWDLSDFSEIGALEAHGDQILCVAWHPGGKFLATFSKDKKIRIFDPVEDTDVLRDGVGPESGKGARMCWCGPENKWILISTCGSGGRMLYLYDSNSFAELASVEVDNSPSVLSLHYDEDSGTVFATGKGDRIIFAYEIHEQPPHFYPLSHFKAQDLHQAVIFLHKNVCNVRDVEFARAVRLTRSWIDQLQFKVPRVKKEYFQDDLFPDTRKTWVPAMSGEEWLDGGDAVQDRVSMKPDDMILLSEAPQDAPKAAKYASRDILAQKTDEEKREELISAMMGKLDVDHNLEQDKFEGVEEEEWDE